MKRHKIVGSRRVQREHLRLLQRIGARLRNGFTLTTDQNVSLKLVRSGATTTAFYKSGGNWVQLAQATTSQVSQAIILLSLKIYGNFGHQGAKIALDNFSLTGTDADCTEIRPNFHPDWAPAAK